MPSNSCSENLKQIRIRFMIQKPGHIFNISGVPLVEGPGSHRVVKSRLMKHQKKKTYPQALSL